MCEMEKKQPDLDLAREVFKYVPDSGDLKRFAVYGFALRGATTLIDHQLLKVYGIGSEYASSGGRRSTAARKNARNLVRSGFNARCLQRGLSAAGRAGVVSAFRLPIYACVENALSVSRGDDTRSKLILHSFAGLAASYIPFRTILASQTTGYFSAAGMHFLFITLLVQRPLLAKRRAAAAAAAAQHPNS